MYAQLFGVLLIVCQIGLNTSAITDEDYFAESIREIRPGSTRPDGYFEFPDVQAVYRVYEDVTTTWYQARDRCVAENAILAIPDSVEKIEHINSLKTKPNSQKWLHTGIRRSDIASEWKRIDNDLPLSDIPWIKGSPDTTGDCSGISTATVIVGLINYGCDWRGEYYVCEKPINASSGRKSEA